MPRLVFINTHAARLGWYFNRRMPRGYRLAAEFWGSGLIDRTKTLYTGFPYEILYPLPIYRGPVDDRRDIASLCDQAGRDIVREAANAQKQIQVLWSGGIDSTAALIGITKAATAASYMSEVEVLLTSESVSEYRQFYQRFVKSMKHRFVSPPVTMHLDPKALTVTGEHGDQIFGSAKVAKYVADGRAFTNFDKTLPQILYEALGSASRADAVVSYLEPLWAASPIRLQSVFDAFWWINFTLKWQIVGLRLAVFRQTQVAQTFRSLRHYFSGTEFQIWSLLNRDKKIGTTWESYKSPLKDYIYSFTGDEEYWKNKTKQPSLRAVLSSDLKRQAPGVRVMMAEDFNPVFWEFKRAER